MKDNDKLIPAIILIGVAIAFPILMMFIPDNSAYHAPFINKAAFAVVFGFTLWMVRKVWNDDWTWFDSETFNKPAQWVAVTALGIFSYLILFVMHSGPLGTTTNNI